MFRWQLRIGALPWEIGSGYNRCIEHLRFSPGTSIAMIMPPSQPPKRQRFRAELVARVRQEIADGKYDTPDKLEAALERLFDCLSERQASPKSALQTKPKLSGD